MRSGWPVSIRNAVNRQGSVADVISSATGDRAPEASAEISVTRQPMGLLTLNEGLPKRQAISTRRA